MGTVKKIRVVYFIRKPRPLGNFSLEIYFKQVRENLPDPFYGVLCEMPYESNGLFKRLANALYCIFKQGDINHITGDIHYVAAFLKKQKTVLTINDCGILHDTKGLKHKILKFFWFTIPVRKVSLITAISHATKQDIIRFTQCPEEKIKVVYVCVNPIFHRIDKDFNTNKPRILQIGTAHNKNLQRLIPGLKDIPCQLVVIGKMTNELLKQLEANVVDFIMIDRKLTDEEILDEYKKCDMVSFISTLEGFGMPIVEANMVGRVVITGNVTSMPEIAGDAAHLVDPLSVSDINNGFLRIMKDMVYRHNLIRNGFKNAARFSPESIANEFAGIYKSILLNS